jgi:hypothetical protein
MSITDTAGRVIPVIIIFYVIEQAEQMIKIKESKPFTGNRETFLEYVIFVRFLYEPTIRDRFKRKCLKRSQNRSLK